VVLILFFSAVILNKGKVMQLFKEFKTFAMRGNVVDMAIGVIIGAAFGKIVSSLVSDIIMPPLGLILGKMDFSNLFVNLSCQPYETLAEAQKAGAPTINYGIFLNNTISFIIVAFAIFWLIKAMNTLSKKEEKSPAEPPAPTPTENLLMDIRDILKEK